MPTFTNQYVTLGASGPHTRQPRSITSYGGFTPLPGLNPGFTDTPTPGSTVGPITLAAAPQQSGFDLAFINLSGCVGGPQTLTWSSAPGTSLSGTVGPTDPIVALYVYVPVGNGNGNGSGAVIDALDATTNQLLDNDFVTVSPDPGGALTTEANVEGWVSTKDSGYTITADHPNIGPYEALPTTSLFDQWVDLSPTPPPAGLISGWTLTVAHGETVYALALYTDPPPPKPNPCQSIIDELANLSPGDFLNYKAFEAAREALLEQLAECERAHGVLPTPGFNPQPDPPGRQ